MMAFRYLVASLAVVGACTTPPHQQFALERKALGSLYEPPTRSELDVADHGPPPTDYENAIREPMLLHLKDPDSARFRFGHPQKGWAPVCLIDANRKVPSAAEPGRGHDDPTKIFGWDVHFTVNAKNSYGGYGGSTAYRAFFYRGQLAAFLQRTKYRDDWGHPMDGTVLAWPAAVAAAPRPAPATPSR